VAGSKRRRERRQALPDVLGGVVHANHDVHLAFTLQRKPLRLQAGIGWALVRVDDAAECRRDPGRGLGLIVGGEAEVAMVPKAFALLQQPRPFEACLAQCIVDAELVASAVSVDFAPPMVTKLSEQLILGSTDEEVGFDQIVATEPFTAVTCHLGINRPGIVLALCFAGFRLFVN